MGYGSKSDSLTQPATQGASSLRYIFRKPHTQHTHVHFRPYLPRFHLRASLGRSSCTDLVSRLKFNESLCTKPYCLRCVARKFASSTACISGLKVRVDLNILNLSCRKMMSVEATNEQGVEFLQIWRDIFEVCYSRFLVWSNLMHYHSRES